MAFSRLARLRFFVRLMLNNLLTRYGDAFCLPLHADIVDLTSMSAKGHSLPTLSTPVPINVCCYSNSRHPQRFLRIQKLSFGIGKIWCLSFERGAEDMIPHAGGHAKITAMG